MKIKKILIGIDDSTFAHHAAEYGFDLARSTGAVVGLVHIIEPVVLQSNNVEGVSGMVTDTSMAIQESEIIDVQNAQSTIIIDRTIKEFGEGLEIVKFTQYGVTAEGIVDCSKEFNADLIVIGTHRRTGFDRLIMGSVAEHVIRQSEIPVMVVPFVE